MSAVFRRVVAFFVLGAQARVDIFSMITDLLASDFELERALEVAARVAREQGQRVRGWVLGRWRQALGENRFEAVVGGWVPASEGMTFAAYGQVAPVKLFAIAAAVGGLRERLMRSVVRAVAWPVALVLMLVLMLWLAGGVFVPVLEVVVPVERWEPAPRFIHAVSTWLYAHPLLFAVMCAGAIVVVAGVMVGWSGFGRTFLDRFAPFSLYRTVTGASFLFVALEFVAADIDLNERTFALMRRRASPYARSRIAAIERMMARGYGFGQAMVMSGHGFPDPSLVPVVAGLEGVRDWHEKLARFVERWVERSEFLLQARGAALNVVLLVLVTVVMAFMIHAMFSVFAIREARHGQGYRSAPPSAWCRRGAGAAGAGVVRGGGGGHGAALRIGDQIMEADPSDDVGHAASKRGR